MSAEEKKPNEVTVNVEVGKETDHAIGDVIRSLLIRPAAELGDLVSNYIGILGDQVKRKREINARLALDDTRKLLESREIKLLDITPPAEEELHTVLNGMSLSGDEHIRNLWSGLLANALDPQSGYSIERPTTAVIEALSPGDARVVEFGAAVTQRNASIQMEAYKRAGVTIKSYRTIGDGMKIEAARLEMAEEIASFAALASDMADGLHLPALAQSEGWADNLVRLGLIKVKEFSKPQDRPPRPEGNDVDARDLAEVIQYFAKQLDDVGAKVGEAIEPKFLFRVDERSKAVILGFEFTRFGHKFCSACGLLR